MFGLSNVFQFFHSWMMFYEMEIYYLTKFIEIALEWMDRHW